MGGGSVTRSEWADEMTRLEVKLEPFIRTNAQGERYIPPHPTLTPLTDSYGKLISFGLEHGWVEFEKEGA